MARRVPPPGVILRGEAPMMAHAPDSGGSEGNIHAAGDARAPCQSIQGCNAASRIRHADDDPGESAVGTAVDVRHLAATPVGHDVTAEAEVTRVDGRRVAFNVKARDEKEEIGRGTHERMVIDVRRLGERLSAKSKA